MSPQDACASLIFAGYIMSDATVLAGSLGDGPAVRSCR